MKTIKWLLAVLTIIFFTVKISSQVKIGNGSTIIDDGSILEIESTTGAFVPPRMNTVQMNAIPTPLAGSQIYNTDENCIYMFDGTYWRGLCNRIIQRNFGGPTQISGTNSLDITETFTIAGRTNYKVIASFVPQAWVNSSNGNFAGNANILINGVPTNSIRFSSTNHGNNLYRYSTTLMWSGQLDPGTHTITFRVTRTGGSVNVNAEDRRMIIELH